MTADGGRPPGRSPDWLVGLIGATLVVGAVRYLVALGAAALVAKL